MENSGSIRKGSVSFQEYDLTNQFVDGISEYAYLEGSGITDPVTQGTLPASIPDNAKFLCLAMAQLNAAHAEYQTVGKNNKGLVGGYFQAFDEVVGKWTSNLAAKTAGLERCKEICTLINSLNKEVLKSKITLVDKGVFTVENTNDTVKELTIDVYTPIKFNIQMENLSSPHNSGLLLSITSNCELYNYIPTEVSGDDEFRLLLNGYEYGHRAVRLTSANVDSINTNSIWIKPILVYNNATDTIPVTAVHYEITMVAFRHAATSTFEPFNDGVGIRGLSKNLIVDGIIKTVNDSYNKFFGENVFRKQSSKEKFHNIIYNIDNNESETSEFIEYTIGPLVSLPYSKWSITQKYPSMGASYEIINDTNENNNKIQIFKNEIDKLEFSPITTIGLDENIKIREKRHEPKSKAPFEVYEKRIVAFRLGIKDFESGTNEKVIWFDKPGKQQASIAVGYTIPEYVRSGKIKVRISDGVKVYKSTNGIKKPVLPTTDKKGENVYSMEFNLSDPNEISKYKELFVTDNLPNSTLILETEKESQKFEIMVVPNVGKQELLKETVHLNRKASGITWKITPPDWNSSASPKFIVNKSFNEAGEPWAETKAMDERKFDWIIYKDIKDNRWHGNLTYSEITMQFSIADTKPKSPELLNWVELTEDLIFRTDDCDILSQMFTDLIKQSFHWYGHPLNGYGEQSPIPYYSTKAIIEHEKVHGRRYLDGCSEGSKKILLGFNDIFKKYEGLISKITVDGSKSYIEAYKIFEQEINTKIRPVIFGTGAVNSEGEKIDGDINILILRENHHTYNSKDYACAEIIAVSNLLKKIKDKANAIGCTLPQNGKIPEYNCP